MSFNYTYFTSFLNSTNSINFFSSTFYDDLHPLLLPAWRLWKLKSFSTSFSSVLLSTLLTFLGYIEENHEKIEEEEDNEDEAMEITKSKKTIRSSDMLNFFNYLSLLKKLNISLPLLDPLSSPDESSYENDYWVTFTSTSNALLSPPKDSMDKKSEEKKEMDEIFSKINAYSQEISKLVENIYLSKSQFIYEKQQNKEKEINF